MHAPDLRIPLSISTICAVLIACSDPTVPPIASQRMTASEMFEALSDSPCAISLSNGPNSKGFALSSSDLPTNIAAHKEANSRNSKRVGIHFVSVELPPDADGTIGISCIAPTTYSDNLLAQDVMKFSRSGELQTIQNRLGKAVSVKGFAGAREYAKHVLVERQKVGKSSFGLGAKDSLLFASYDSWIPVKSRPCYDYFDGANPFLADGPGVPIAPVVVTGTYNPPYPIDLEDAIRSLNRRGFRSFGDFLSSSFNDGPNCAYESEVWTAYQNAAQELENEGAAMDAAANSVQNAVCEQPGTVAPADQTVCIDFFIMSKTAFLIMEGDDRGFDPNAKYTASRAQIYVNPSTGQHTLKLNTSTIDFVPGDSPRIPLMNGIERQPMRHLPKDVSVVRDANTGELTVRVELYNAFCSTALRAVCPSIDATFSLQMTNGTLQATPLQIDKYPSVQVNQWTGSTWTERWRDEEHPGLFGPRFLINIRPLADYLRQHHDMPDGCMIQ